MPGKNTSEEAAPKKLTTYTHKLDAAQFARLEQWCEARGWERFSPEYTRFAYKGPKVTVAAYTSGKLVVSGRETEDFVVNVLESEITGEPRLGYDEVLHPEWFEPHAGMDESGKGDFFGPVIAATVIADRPAVEAWMAAGVKDSKRLADTQILKLDKLIRGTRGVAVETCFCGMHKYNELMSRPRANLNRLLAWQHATALLNALKHKPVPWGLLDQFSTEPLVQRELAKHDGGKFELRMRTRAEEDPVVAAASVVARAAYVRVMKELSQEWGEPLLKGAGTAVSAQALRIVEQRGARVLRDFAKLHFRTAWEVVSKAGKLGELPLPKPPERVEWRRPNQSIKDES